MHYLFVYENCQYSRKKNTESSESAIGNNSQQKKNNEAEHIGVRIEANNEKYTTNKLRNDLELKKKKKPIIVRGQGDWKHWFEEEKKTCLKVKVSSC